MERVIACTSEQCAGGGCGQATTVIGYEESEQLDVEPVKYIDSGVSLIHQDARISS